MRLQAPYARCLLGGCSSEGFFVADLIFTENYPNEPPTMKFITPMWHPNSEFADLFLNTVNV